MQEARKSLISCHTGWGSLCQSN